MDSVSQDNNLIIICENMENQYLNSSNVIITTEEAEYLIVTQCNESINEENSERDETACDTEEFFSTSEFSQCNNERDGNMSDAEEFFSPLDITNDSSSGMITSDMSSVGDEISDITQFSAEPENSHTVTNKDKRAEDIETELQETKTVQNNQLAVSTRQKKMESEEDNELLENLDTFCTLKKEGDIETHTMTDQNTPQSNSNITKNRDVAVQVASQQINSKLAPKTVDVSIQTDLSMNLNSPRVHDEAIQFPSEPLNRPESEIKEINVGVQVDSEFDISSQQLGVNSLDVFVGTENSDTSLNNISVVFKSQNSTHSFNHENIDTDSEMIDSASVISNTDTESDNQRVSKRFRRTLKMNSPSGQKQVLCTPPKINLNETRENLHVIEGANPKVSIATNLNDLDTSSSSTDQSATLNLPKLGTFKLSEPLILCADNECSDDDIIVISSDSESEQVNCTSKNNIEPKNRVGLNTTKNTIKRKQSDDCQIPCTSKSSQKNDSNVEKEMHALRMRCFNCHKHMYYIFLKRKGKSKHIVICEFCDQRHFVRYNDDSVICSVQRENEVSKK